jgi:hypothetical protein
VVEEVEEFVEEEEAGKCVGTDSRGVLVGDAADEEAPGGRRDDAVGAFNVVLEVPGVADDAERRPGNLTASAVRTNGWRANSRRIAVGKNFVGLGHRQH